MRFFVQIAMFAMAAMLFMAGLGAYVGTCLSAKLPRHGSLRSVCVKLALSAFIWMSGLLWGWEILRETITGPQQRMILRTALALFTALSSVVTTVGINSILSRGAQDS